MSWELTGGALKKILNGETPDAPLLQVLGHKQIAGSGGTNCRYRILLSDGVYSQSSAMLGSQLNEKITSGELDTNSVIRVNKFLCNKISQDRLVVILLDIDILARGASGIQMIGQPQPLKGGGKAAGGAAAANPSSRPTPSVPAQTAASSHASGAAAAPQQRGGGGASFYGNSPRSGSGKPTSGRQNIPTTPGGTQGKVYPISSLTPYQNRWTIRVRVTSKSAVRTWSNSRGEGKLFSMNLLDESGEIKATAFKEQCDKYYDIVEVNKVYYITKGTLKTADKRYSTLNNDYEMTFNNDTQLMPCEDDTDLPSVSFTFVPINQLTQYENQALVDVIGVVKDVADLSVVVGKASNREIKKRDVQLVDKNQVQVRLTLWGSDAESFDGSANPVLAVKGAKVSDWGGRSLSALGSSQLVLNPDITECHELRGWYDSVGHSLDYDVYSNDGGGSGSGAHAANWKSFAEVKGQNVGTDKPEYFTTKATIVHLRKENCMYTACPSEGCNKKVIDQGNNMYRCEKCQKEYPDFKWRMILSVSLADYSDNQWVTCFQEQGETIIGRSADELGAIRENEVEFDQVFQEANFKSYIFKSRAKMETYNDETRLKIACVSATPVDYREYSKKLIEDIEKLTVQ